jgi:uncharacterized protein
MMNNIFVRKPTPAIRKLLESCPIWEHEPETFPAHSGNREETCLVIEGKVEIQYPDGEHVYFSAGDLVTFAPNTDCIWAVKEKIRKHYIFDMQK